jgi:isoleucyl-tRNA synthetase
MPAAKSTAKDFGDKYRKVRNTIRYLLSNIDDFDPKKDAAVVPENSLDYWMLNELGALYREAIDAYENYKFHVVFRLLHDFCAVQISSVYGNAMKDRLYCEKPNSPLRRRSQLVMYECATVLIQLLAPMCVFTADEAWDYLKHKPADVDSVHLTTFRKHEGKEHVKLPDALSASFTLLMKLRDSALLQLDALKKNVGLNKALDAEVIYAVKSEGERLALSAFGVDLEDLVGAGYHSIVVDPTVAEPTVTIVDRRNDYPACARSWKRRPDVGADATYPDLCTRDADAVKSAK